MNQNKNILPSVRPDIQGLRAIAVLVVVIFHILPYGLTGGYLGVDMFFVISGFVVTKRLTAQWRCGELDIREFYRSRFIRLAPALLMMLLVSTILAFYLLLPAELNTFAVHVVGVLTFSINFILMAESGYFSQAAESLPLLHTWSLAVEEHFYLVLPAIFVFLKTAPYRMLIMLMALICVVSFCAGLWLQQNYTEISFYLSPLRFYQFLAGSLAAGLRIRQTNTSLGFDSTCMLAFGTLIACFISYDKTTLPLGFTSLVPTFCTALLLVLLPSTKLSFTALSLRPLRAIGDSSYSIYLWHWPIIVFYKMSWSVHIDSTTAILLLISSLFAGVLSYHLIEQPWRGRGPLAKQLIYQYPLRTQFALAVLLLTTAIVIYAQNGLPKRFSAQQQQDAGFLQRSNSHYRQGKCFLTSENVSINQYDTEYCLNYSLTLPNVLLLGDSHAAHLYHALQQTSPQYNWLQANASGCKPLLPWKGRPQCTALYRDTIWPLLERQPPDAIVLSATWLNRDSNALLQTVLFLKQFAPVYIIGPSVQYEQALPRLLVKHDEHSDWHQLSSQQHTLELDKYLQEILEGIPDIQYLSLYRQQCPAGICQKRAENGAPIIWDHNHFTLSGSMLVASGLVKQITVVKRKAEP